MATVLVVDDESAIRALIGAALAEHTVIEAADGPSALALARAHRPEVILLDIALPGLNGLDVCRRLKADPATADAAVLFLTGLAQAPDRLAADGWIAKPFSPGTVVREVDQALRLRAAANPR